MTTLAVVWLITDQLLAGYLPLQWGGGPNIGRGFILLCTYALLAAGLAMVALSGGFEMRSWRRTSWVVGGTILALVVVFGFVKIVEPRDEEAGLVGRLGIAASPAGDPIVVLAVCRGSIDTVRVVGPYRSDRPDEPNELLASYKAHQSVRDLAQFELLQPGDGWTAAPGLHDSDIDEQRVVIVAATGPRAALATVSFDRSDLAAVAPGEVLQGQGPSALRRPLTEFRDVACAAER